MTASPRATLTTSNYRMRVLSDPAEVDPAKWDAIAYPDDRSNPFMRHAFFDALTASGCASEATGWMPLILALESDQRLEGLVATFQKSHSYGEYVFDWAWADAYQRHELAYYPKLLCAVPFTPVTGPRLMAGSPDVEALLAEQLVAVAHELPVSSLHVLFADMAQARLLEAAGCMLREGVQFHWLNAGFSDFEAFLASLERKKRKNIRQERRRVADQGVQCVALEGPAISDSDWRFFMACYSNTYRNHYSTPYLSLDFFKRIGETMPENLLMFVATRNGRRIAASLIVRNATTLYGRYWGALETVDCLHFECAYYQPIDYCITHGLAVIEGGAQGEHKMARGFLPVKTYSAHWLRHPAFADAVAEFLARERSGMDDYVNELNEHNPFKQGPEGTP